VDEIGWLVARRAETPLQETGAGATPPGRAAPPTTARTGDVTGHQRTAGTFQGAGRRAVDVVETPSKPLHSVGSGALQRVLESARLASQVQRNLQMASGMSLVARAPAISGLHQMLESVSLAARGPSKDYKLFSGLVTRSSAVSALQQTLESAGLVARSQMRNYQLLSGMGARKLAVSGFQQALQSAGLVAWSQARDYQALWDMGVAAKNFKSVETSRMLANVHAAASFEAARIDPLPEHQVDRIVGPESVGWLPGLLRDEARFRAVVPYLATSSVGCMLVGLQLVALVDPAVRAALEVASDNAAIAALLVALVMLANSRRP
jgi:hypothetical protein